MASASLLCLLCLVSLSVGFNPSSYTNTIALLPNQYNLYWRIDNATSTIYVALQVQTVGWVGLGLAEPTSGSMPGADMLTGWVTNGVAYIQDRHAVEKAYPLEDDCANWVLVAGEENATWTVIEAHRQLDTGDSQDRPITGRNRIVFAFGTSDEFGYHGTTNRHFTAVTFFGPTATSAVVGNPEYTTYDFLNVNYTIPATETTYLPVNFLYLPLPRDVHVVRLEQMVDPIGAPYVHHFLVYGCHNSTCFEPIWAWAPGVDPMELPPNVGFRVGPSAGAWNGIQLQIHYNNPAPSVSGIVDNSGVRVYYTPNLRQYDADILELGDPLVTYPTPIPQGTGMSYFEYNCPSECTSLAITTPLNVFGDFLHMHQQGKVMWTTHWRNGTLLGNLNRVEFWDFNFQQTTPKSTVILPGDRFNTHCIYAQNPAKSTKFSIASADEMCLEYVYYYPKMVGPYCAFAYSGNRNYTVCLQNALPSNATAFFNNPTMSDPPGGDIITFGAPNPASFVCPTTASQSQGGSQSSSPIGGSSQVLVNSGSVFVASVVVVLMAVLFL